jgi:hypothetical protein
VYIFEGIAKLNSDWLFEAQPLKYWLHTAHDMKVVGNVLKEDWVAYLFSWFGCIYDLTIVFFLLWKPTRKWAYLAVIAFHLLTWILFPIGIFPWVMMTGTLIFFSTNFHERILRPFTIKKINYEISRPSSLIIRGKFVVLVPFIIFQLLFPLRSMAYDGDVFWTESGYRFSWRVMLMEKTGFATFFVRDETKEYEIDNEWYLNKNQEKMMSCQPDMILDYAHFLGEKYQDTTFMPFGQPLSFKNPEICGEIYVTVNGRPNQLYVDKKHNLLEIKNDLSQRTWLEPFNK